VGATVELLDHDALAARFPWMNLEDVAAGSIGTDREGWFDAWSLFQSFRRKAISLGADYIKGAVTGVERDGNRITGVTLDNGEHIACGALVNAAGPWAGDVAALAGVDLPVRPRKRFVHVIDCRTPIPDCPMVIDSADQNAILGPHPEIGNLLFANGFSGHGMQQTPAVGRVTADWIIHGEARALDVSVFGYERFAEGRLVKEVNVI
jgi:glycine/D-amino acid oxidase-like deaminating enzyme